MMCRSLRLLALIVWALAGMPLSFAQDAAKHHLPKRIVADYVYWSKYSKPAYSATQIPYSKLTHIIHASVGFAADGSLTPPSGFIEPELINLAHAAGVKVLLLTGGDFGGVEKNGTLDTLVANLNAFVSQYGYDGVDVDWEFPSTNEDLRFFDDLMAKLRAANPDYVLSIDVAPWGFPYDFKKLKTSLDFFNIMMYDCAGPWTAHGQLNSPIFWDWHNPAPYECEPGGSVKQTANIFLKHVPAEQLNMGTPFYGYHYASINQLFELCPNAAYTRDGNCDNTVYTANYSALKGRINKNGWYTTYDPIAMVPYMLKTDGSEGFITYDDAFSTYFRVWYADWDRGLGGTFMWSLDADYDGRSQDLLDAMYQATVSGH